MKSSRKLKKKLASMTSVAICLAKRLITPSFLNKSMKASLSLITSVTHHITPIFLAISSPVTPKSSGTLKTSKAG